MGDGVPIVTLMKPVSTFVAVAFDAIRRTTLVAPTAPVVTTLIVTAFVAPTPRFALRFAGGMHEDTAALDGQLTTYVSTPGVSPTLVTTNGIAVVVFGASVCVRFGLTLGAMIPADEAATVIMLSVAEPVSVWPAAVT